MNILISVQPCRAACIAVGSEFCFSLVKLLDKCSALLNVVVGFLLVQVQSVLLNVGTSTAGEKLQKTARPVS